jgi:hypothetical protein
MTTPVAPTMDHPDRPRWVEDERRCRASFLATRRHLSPFLVPHRFEGKVEPTKLVRAAYGYGIPLNQAYVTEITGHIRSATVTRELAALDSDLGQQVLVNADGRGLSWDAVMHGKVLEWLCTSLGGFLLVDAPAEIGETRAEQLAGRRLPYLRWIPWSAVRDFATGDDGLRWLTFEETRDERQPDGTGKKVQARVTYRLQDGRTIVERDETPAVDIGPFVSATDRPTLPLVPVRFGEHPDVPEAGAGLLLALSDIVIDLYNRTSETAEGYRSAVFGVFVYTGDDSETIRSLFEEGTRFMALGSDPNAKLERLAAEANEVDAGLRLIEQALKAWALGAKKQASEAMATSGNARSGVSLQAEFQLDLRPLLVSLCETLNEIEQQALRLVAQFLDMRPDGIAVTRNTTFQLEDEATRIARIVGDFASSIALPAEAKTRLGMAWLAASRTLDLTENAEGGGTVGEQIEAQWRALTDAQQEQAVRGDLFGLSGDGLPTGAADPVTPDAPAAAPSTAAPPTLAESQVARAIEIVTKVADRTIPRDAGRALLVAFLGYTAEQADALLGSAGTEAPTPPAPPVDPALAA